MTTRQLMLALAAGLLAAFSASPSPAQDYPAHAVRIVVPFGAGGPADVAARLIGQALQERFGQPFVVENRSGAGGVIGTVEAAKSPADGYTLKEGVRFDRTHITSTSWTNYPILTFSEVPMVDVEIIQRPEIEPIGAGEATHGPVTAAIANAVHDCLGVRVRDLPITRDKIIAAMELAS